MSKQLFHCLPCRVRLTHPCRTPELTRIIEEAPGGVAVSWLRPAVFFICKDRVTCSSPSNVIMVRKNNSTFPCYKGSTDREKMGAALFSKQNIPHKLNFASSTCVLQWLAHYYFVNEILRKKELVPPKSLIHAVSPEKLYIS